MCVNDKDVKEHYLYKHLQENLAEACSYITELSDNYSRMALEMDYLQDFIKYQGLESEYSYFREHAHQDESEDLPFPSYTL